MRHRLQHKLFDGKKSKSRSPSTFINMLHSKSTYFYRWESSRKNINLSRLSYVVPSVCGLALLIGGIVALNPTIQNHANQALAIASDSGGDESSGPSDKIYDPSISLELIGGDPEQTINALANSVTYRTNKLRVTTQDVDGFQLLVQAAPGYTNELKGLNNPDQSIGGVGLNVSTEHFPVNTWGYSVGVNGTETIDPKDLQYNTVPNSGEGMYSPAFKSEKNSEELEFTLAFAAKFGDDKPSDHYSTKVMSSVIAGAEIVANSWDSMIYMQSMTSDICKSEKTEVGATKQLIDNRDGKKYWIAKLADGNCWMTQNLDLDLDNDRILSPDNTDVTYKWLPNANTITNVSEWQDSSEGIIQSIDLGMKLDSKTGTDVAGMAPSDDPDFANKLSNGVYNAHYLIGNYYSWAAATAGSGPGVQSGDVAPASICPKGWKLPPYNDEGSFYNLFNYYGVQDKKTGVGKDGKNYNINEAPLYILTDVGKMDTSNVGSSSSIVLYDGGYWESVPVHLQGWYNPSNYAYAVWFFSDEVRPTYDSRWVGRMAVRCVAR